MRPAHAPLFMRLRDRFTNRVLRGPAGLRCVGNCEFADKAQASVRRLWRSKQLCHRGLDCRKPFTNAVDKQHCLLGTNAMPSGHARQCRVHLQTVRCAAVSRLIALNEPDDTGGVVDVIAIKDGDERRSVEGTSRSCLPRFARSALLAAQEAALGTRAAGRANVLITCCPVTNYSSGGARSAAGGARRRIRSR